STARLTSAPTLAALPTARANSVCAPSASGAVGICVAPQGVYGSESNRHNTVAPASLVPSLNFGEAVRTTPLGPPIVADGGLVSPAWTVETGSVSCDVPDAVVSVAATTWPAVEEAGSTQIPVGSAVLEPADPSTCRA